MDCDVIKWTRHDVIVKAAIDTDEEDVGRRSHIFHSFIQAATRYIVACESMWVAQLSVLSVVMIHAMLLHAISHTNSNEHIFLLLRNHRE